MGMLHCRRSSFAIVSVYLCLSEHKTYTQVASTDFFPQCREPEVVRGLFSDSLNKSVDIRSVIQLNEQSHEELDITCGVNEMSTDWFVLGLPNLKYHRFGEDLL